MRALSNFWGIEHPITLWDIVYAVIVLIVTMGIIGVVTVGLIRG